MLLKGYFGTLNRKQRESLEVTLRNVIRLDDVIINLLEMSRIEAGRLKLEIIDTDLQEEFERLRIEMKHLMEEKHVNIMFNTENLGLIPVDSDRIIQVLRILINNAIKFSPQRGDVKVKVEKNKNEAIFSVQDFGRGIEKEKQKKIFQAFYQAEETMYRKYGGIGLGLSIAKGIVEALGGKIWFESKRGKGTTFYFTVMLKPIKKAKPIKMIKPIKLLK
jgi:signal transduction histidine kinase